MSGTTSRPLAPAERAAVGPEDDRLVAARDVLARCLAGVVGDGLLVADLLLDVHQRVEDGLGARRAAGDVDVDGHEVVDALHDAVAAVHAARRGARALGDAPLRAGHLVPDAADGVGHLVRAPPGDDHQVRLAGREAHGLATRSGPRRTSGPAKPIISMAQQARPIGIGMSEFERAQLTTESTVVVRNPPSSLNMAVRRGACLCRGLTGGTRVGRRGSRVSAVFTPA